MRILVLTSQPPYPWWHYGRYSMYFLFKSLIKRGLRLLISFPFSKSTPHCTLSDLESLTREGFEIIPFNLDTRDRALKLLKNVIEKDPFKINKYYSKKYEKFLLEKAKQFKPNIVQVHTSHMFKLGWSIAQEIKVPIIIRQQDIVHEQLETFIETTKNPIYRLIARWQLTKTIRYEVSIWQRADKIVFLNKENMEYVKNNFNIPEHKLVYIPDGIMPKENFYIKNKNKLRAFVFAASDQVPNVISLRHFINVYKSIRKTGKYNLDFHIYGNVCKAFMNEKSQLEKEGILLKGFVDNRDELDEIISRYLFFISPTIQGSGYRTKILDFAAIGMPIVTSEFDYNGVKDRLGDVLLVYRNRNDLMKILDDIVNNKLNLFDISRKIHEKVKSYSWDIISESFLSLYNSISIYESSTIR